MLRRLLGAAGYRKSSPEASSLAGTILRRPRCAEGEKVSAYDYNRLLTEAKRLAGSVLSQDEVAD